MRVCLISLICILLLLGCEKIHYYPDKLIEIKETQLIAHRGGRDSLHRENTLNGVKSALKYNAGVEVDVQISKNESIWLSHSPIVINCGKELKCFPESQDKEIESIGFCSGNDNSYTRLESVFKYISDSFPDKKISIDLKGWFPCSGNSADIEGMMRKESEIILDLARKYSLLKNLIFEIETTTVLDYIKSKNTEAEVYLTAYGDFERAMLISLKQNYSGISYKNNVGEELSKEKVSLLHRKGLKIMVWNLMSKSEIPNLSKFGVDYIQLDL